MKKLFILLCLLISCNAYSIDAVYLGSWSYHFEPHESGFEYNEKHNLFALQKNGYTVGTFKNSFYRQTYFVTKSIYNFEYKDINFVLNAGFSHGYGACASDAIRKERKLCGLILPEFIYTKHKWQPSFSATHKVVNVSFRYAF